MYVRVFIGVYAWKFICMRECLEVYMYARVFIGVYARVFCVLISEV